MNSVPTILTQDGFEVDNNGLLTELVVPHTVATLKMPTKIVFNGNTLSWLPSNAASLQTFEAPNCTTIPSNLLKSFTNLTSVNLNSLVTIRDAGSNSTTTGTFYGCTRLTSISLPSLTTLSNGSGSSAGGTFYGCTGLTSINLPSLTTIICESWQAACGAFYGCTGLTSINLPALTTFQQAGSKTNAGAFKGCTSLVTVTLPSLVSNDDTGTGTSTFGNCTSLTTVQLGSVGHAVTALGQYMFKGCTQSNLTITVYTNGGASLANEPWGATGAAIVYETA